MSYAEIQCPNCKARMTIKALQKRSYFCPGCGKKKTSRPWKEYIVE